MCFVSWYKLKQSNITGGCVSRYRKLCLNWVYLQVWCRVLLGNAIYTRVCRNLRKRTKHAKTRWISVITTSFCCSERWLSQEVAPGDTPAPMGQTISIAATFYTTSGIGENFEQETSDRPTGHVKIWSFELHPTCQNLESRIEIPQWTKWPTGHPMILTCLEFLGTWIVHSDTGLQNWHPEHPRRTLRSECCTSISQTKTISQSLGRRHTTAWLTIYARSGVWLPACFYCSIDFIADPIGLKS